MNTDGTLTLAPGTYTFCDWLDGGDTTVTYTAGTIVQVEETFNINGGSEYGTWATCDATFWIRGDGKTGTSASDIAIQGGQGLTAYGQFYDPNSRTKLGRSADWYGFLYGRDFGSDFNTNVYACGAQYGGATATTGATTTSTATTTTTPDGSDGTTTTQPGGGGGGGSTTSIAVAPTSAGAGNGTLPRTGGSPAGTTTFGFGALVFGSVLLAWERRRSNTR